MALLLQFYLLEHVEMWVSFAILFTLNECTELVFFHLVILYCTYLHLFFFAGSTYLHPLNLCVYFSVFLRNLESASHLRMECLFSSTVWDLIEL